MKVRIFHIVEIQLSLLLYTVPKAVVFRICKQHENFEQCDAWKVVIEICFEKSNTVPLILSMKNFCFAKTNTLEDRYSTFFFFCRAKIYWMKKVRREVFEKKFERHFFPS